MTDQRMKAMPARKNSSWVTSAAAIRLPTSPVTEIAFGVSRDSISRLRARSRTSAVVRRPPSPPGSALWLATEGQATACVRRVRQAHASGLARASAYEAPEAEIAATRAPSAASSQKWLAVTITTKVTTTG